MCLELVLARERKKNERCSSDVKELDVFACVLLLCAIRHIYLHVMCIYVCIHWKNTTLLLVCVVYLIAVAKSPLLSDMFSDGV